MPSRTDTLGTPIGIVSPGRFPTYLPLSRWKLPTPVLEEPTRLSKFPSAHKNTSSGSSRVQSKAYCYQLPQTLILPLPPNCSLNDASPLCHRHTSTSAKANRLKAQIGVMNDRPRHKRTSSKRQHLGRRIRRMTMYRFHPLWLRVTRVVVMR